MEQIDRHAINGLIILFLGITSVVWIPCVVFVGAAFLTCAAIGWLAGQIFDFGD